ncbi:MAG: hypothetical protein HOP20_03615 [Sulfuriferula sp.]|nr:hypothetical protein [Sulfuriferula sp.]
MKRLLSIALLTLLATAAQAHYLWLAPSTGGTALYFGELQNELKEKSPGTLDKMKNVKASTSSGAVIVGTMQSEQIYYTHPAKEIAITVAQEELPVREGHDDKIMTKSVLYARLGQGGTSLPLDLQMTGKQVQVIYDGKPLPKASLILYSENGWQRSLHADDAGRAEIILPWAGRYVLHVKHSLNTPGTFAGKPYTVKNIITTLSLVQP